MHTITLPIELLEPLLCTALEGEPNSAVSYDMIPGTVLRGAIIGLYISKHGKESITPEDKDSESARLFFSSAVRFLNATPQIGDQAAQVIPATWKRKKRGQDRTAIKDKAHDADFGNDKASTPSGYAVIKGHSVTIVEPQRVLNVHVQRKRRHETNGRYEEGSPLPYRYDALAAGQTFVATIQCEHESDAKRLEALLNDYKTLYMGGARSAGYGKVKLTQITNTPTKSPDATAKPKDDKPVIVTLRSDCILRDANGEYLPTLEALQQALGCTNVDVTASSLDTTLVGGFNRKWGVPLPQTPAFRAGSVIVLNQPEDIWDHLQSLLQNGIGERTNEGFGQVAINWQADAKYTLVELTNETKKQDNQQEVMAELRKKGDDLLELSKQATDPLEHKQATDLLERLQRTIDILQRIEHIDAQSDPVGKIFLVADPKTQPYAVYGGRITRTQLQNLRTYIADTLRNGEPTYETVITNFFTQIQGKEADRQYERARIQGRSLKDWLQSGPFKQLDGGQSVSQRDQLRMVDAVLERAVKDKER
jgi:CRISPR-associated protein Csx10